MGELVLNRAVIIAEACCNHMGNVELAMEMIEKAKNNGADYIKFQKRNIDVWTKKKQNVYKKAHPNQKNSFGQTYEEHRKFLEFDLETHKKLKKYCDEIGIKYACSVFDISSAKEIITLAPDFIKIPSACNLNFELLDYICENYNGNIHISTGMTSKTDLNKIINFFKQKGRCKSLILYACTSAYPLNLEDVCLLEISSLKNMYGNLVNDIGYSGHHQGLLVDHAAYTLGAIYLERHFTLNKKFKGTDQSASITPRELHQLRVELDNLNKVMTKKKKDILEVEFSNKEKLKW